MIAVEDVRAALRTTVVLDHFGARYRDHPQIRLRECPRCGEKSKREAIVIDRERGTWIHHGGASAADATCKGDLLELVAAYAGLDRRTQFAELLAVAAPIAGISATTDGAEMMRIRAEREREQLAYERERADRRAAATAAVSATWDGLARRSAAGERYLSSRGLDPTDLVARDIVRYQPDGSPAVRLYSFDTGSPVNILTRNLTGEPKVLAMTGCTTDGTIIGRIGEIDRQGPDVAVLVEGMTDALVAVLAFPGCVVVGANGAGKLASVAAAVAPVLAAIGGWLVVVPDVDATGEMHAAEAVISAMAAGLVLDKSIHLADVRPHKDLAEAYRASWRWSWPS